MRCQFVVGQRVVCVLDGPWMRYPTLELDHCGPKKNEICVVEEISDFGQYYVNENFPAIGLRLRGHEGHYIYTLFRPLSERPKETSIEVFKTLLPPTPAKVREDA